ncbi:4'-phosphopantetheinyl transferase superfamily protein [Microbispora sp. NPDC088329]|uniref:4'-phosphopantetheinyl transferase family protein n=1 Tax=Microbispora sp. NPDC088329 TaxID=3154869 RepID=UPI003441CFA4
MTSTGPAVCEVWWAGVPDAAPAHLERLLSPPERARLDGLRRGRDRARFVVGVALTRLVAGARLGTAPDRVAIDRTCPDCPRPHGKPCLRGTGIGLSVSHSAGKVVLAVADVPQVGVDVERVALDRPIQAMAARVLARPELAQLRRLGEDGHGFTRYWTRKEALLKATGDGLRVAMRALTVSAPDEPPRLLDWVGRPELTSRFALRDLDPGEGYAAALAVAGARDPVVVETDAGPLLAGRA